MPSSHTRKIPSVTENMSTVVNVECQKTESSWCLELLYAEVRNPTRKRAMRLTNDFSDCKLERSSVYVDVFARSFPVQTKREDLYAACREQMTKEVWVRPLRTSIQMNPTMMTVLNAIVLLKSFSSSERKMIVPNESRNRLARKLSNSTPRFQNEKIPAMTSVQECSKLETGVGPSIASGSQRYEIPTTDLKMSAEIRRKTAGVSREAQAKSRTVTANKRKTSPTRLNPIAE